MRDAMAGAEPGLTALTAGLEASGRWLLANRAIAQLMFWRPVPNFEPSPEAVRPQRGDGRPAARRHGRRRRRRAARPRGRLRRGHLPCLHADHRSAQPGHRQRARPSWGQGRFTPLFPRLMRLLPAAFPLPARRRSFTSPACGGDAGALPGYARPGNAVLREGRAPGIGRPLSCSPSATSCHRRARACRVRSFAGREGAFVRRRSTAGPVAFLAAARDVAGPRPSACRPTVGVRRHACAGGAQLPDVPGRQRLEHADHRAPRRQALGAGWLRSMDSGSHVPRSRLWPGWRTNRAEYGIPWASRRPAPHRSSSGSTLSYADQSDRGPVPVQRPDADRGRGSGRAAIRHALMVEPTTCALYELLRRPFPTPAAARRPAGAIWSLYSTGCGPQTWTSADAAGLPILPGLHRRLRRGHVRPPSTTPIRFTADTTDHQLGVWPARHEARARFRGRA